MKIRIGFVSNSSSSSFVINSNRFDFEEVETKMEEIKAEFPDSWFEYDVRVITEKIYKHGYWYLENSDIGNIEIISSEDNSIPYDAFDIIEDTFDCVRRHLG